jgi:hypothetical protein
MFGFKKKNPAEKLEKEWKMLLEKARDTQRAGDMKGYAQIMEKADELEKRLLAK